MKKIILSTITIFTVSLATQAQFKVGLKASANIHHQYVDGANAYKYSNDNLGGSYQAGIITDIPLGTNLYLQPQVLFARKSAGYVSKIGANEMDVKMSYLELPVNLVYKFELPFGKLFAGAGGTFSYAIAGKEKTGDASVKLFKGSANDWKREDIAVNATAGIELRSGLTFGIGMQKGLMDIYRKAGTVRNNSYSLTVAYMIDWKRLIGKG